MNEDFFKHVGCINENKGKNWILGSLKYIIMFVKLQYYFAYRLSADQKIAVSVCVGTLINKMVVSNEIFLNSSEVECIGQANTLF